MASYAELKSLESDPILLGKVEAALWVSLNTIAGEAAGTPNHAARVAFAVEAIKDTTGTARKLFKLALAANAAATISSIQSATDASLLTVVNNSISLLAGVTT